MSKIVDHIINQADIIASNARDLAIWGEQMPYQMILLESDSLDRMMEMTQLIQQAIERLRKL